MNMATSAAAEPAESTMLRRWYVLAITMLVYTFSIADRYVISTVLEPIRLEFHLNETRAGVFTGVALGLFYVTMGLPMSWLADRRNRKNLLTFAIAAWSVMTTVCGFVTTPFQLMLARIGVGIGEAGGTPPCNTIIADYFPPARRPMATTIFALGAPIGAWLGSDLAGQVAHLYKWRAAFLVLGIPGLVLALVIFFTIKEPPRGRYDACTKEVPPSVGETVRFMARQTGGLHVMMGSGLSALWGWGLMWFTPAYIERMYHMGDGSGGVMLSPIHMIGGVGASLLTAWLVARPEFVDQRRILRLLAVVTALATVPSFYAYYTRDMTVMQVMLWLYVPAIYFYLGPSFAAVQNAAPPRMRAIFIAVSLLLANVFNLIVAPWFVGTLSDYFSGGQPTADSLRLALLVLAPSGLWAAFHYWRAERHLEADAKRISDHA
jgi:MFS family permease